MELFVEASMEDPYLMEASGSRSHGDGWGYAVAYVDDGRTTVDFYKTSRQIWSERDRLRELIERFKGHSSIYGLLHSRKAGSTEPIGEEHSHPYRYSLNGQEMFFIHNGGVDKYRLAEEVGFKDPGSVTDSYLAGLYLMNSLRGGLSVVEAYRKLLAYTKSALNTGVLFMDAKRGYVDLYAASFIAQRDEPRLKYYALYHVDLEGLSTVFSSTIASLAEQRGLASPTKIEEGRLLKLTVDGEVTSYSLAL